MTDNYNQIKLNKQLEKNEINIRPIEKKIRSKKIHKEIKLLSNVLSSWNFRMSLFTSLLFSLLESYFHILVKFNSNLIFSSSKDPKKFDFMFFEKYLGENIDPKWCLQLFKFISVAFFAEKISNSISCFFNRETSKISESIVSTILLEQKNEISANRKVYLTEAAREKLSERIAPLFEIIVSFAQLAFESWFFWYSILKKEKHAEGGRRLLDHFIISFFSLAIYNLFSFIKKILLKKSFIEKNRKYKHFLEKESIFAKENISFFNLIPNLFAPFYFWTFVLRAMKKELPKNEHYYTVLRIDSFLFAAYLVSFSKKTIQFAKSFSNFKKLVISEEKKEQI